MVEITIDGINYRKRVCVDGKQRLSSVRAFTKGEIPCHDLNGGKWYFDHKNGAEISRRRHVWPKKNQEDFKAKEFLCYEYEGLTPEQEEDLFARVQKGIPLNPAEKLRATSGPWQDLAKRFEVEFTEVVNRKDAVASECFIDLTRKQFALGRLCSEPADSDLCSLALLR